MSGSAPDLPENSPVARASWLALSLVFHGGLLACLILLIPAAEIAVVSESGEVKPAAPVMASPERIKEVAEQIQATQADEVRSKVEELLGTERALAELQQQTQTEFGSLAQEMAAAAPEKSADALSVAIEAQARAEQAQAEAQAALEAMNKAREAAAGTPAEMASNEDESAAALLHVSEAQSRAKDAQTAATTAQVTAFQQMSFQGGLDRAKEAQTQAANAQAEANARQDEAIELQGSLQSLGRQAQRTTENLAKAQKAVVLGEQRVADKEKAKTGLEENARQQRERVASAKNTKDAAKLQNSLDPLTRRLADAKKDLQKLEERLAADANHLTLAEEAAKKSAQEVLDARGQLAATQAAALKAQQSARESQTKAQLEVAKAFASAAPITAAMEPVEMSASTSLDGQSFSSLYAQAVLTEKSIAERFQAIRAAQVAVQKQIPLPEAQKYVQMALPLRSELASDLSSAQTAEELAAQNAAIEKALKELESMLALARGMEYQARTTASSAGEGTSVSLESMKALAAQEEQLAGLAAENENQAAMDLSALMKQIGGGVQTGGAGNLAGGPPGAGQSGFPGGGRAGGFAGPPGFPASGAVQDSIPGRKVHASGYGEGAKWMFIDSWWVIGPFPNPQRRNIEQRFPPESVVDLDAVYPVENGVVRWQFIQNAKAMVQPPNERSYAIYFAYTELWFEEAQDLWIAMGSDDFSKIWINDMLVWASGMQHKIWRPNEGYRKVHFKKGLNRLLMRVENGHHSCSFSLMVAMQSQR